MAVVHGRLDFKRKLCVVCWGCLVFLCEFLSPLTDSVISIVAYSFVNTYISCARLSAFRQANAATRLVQSFGRPSLESMASRKTEPTVVPMTWSSSVAMSTLGWERLFLNRNGQ
jgi:hypothetical protein